MSQPITKWYCDVCGEVIDDVKKGYVIWKSNEHGKSHAFKIIHQTKCDQRDHSLSAALRDFVGDDGMTKLLSHLSLGPIKRRLDQTSRCDVADFDEFVDFFRRVQTPFYEEARRHFGNENLIHEFSDANEVLPYMQSELEKIAKR